MQTLSQKLETRHDEACPHCGAAMREYRHALGGGLVSALVAFARAGGGPIHLEKVNLSRHQWTNFQKLRYWELVAKAELPDRQKGIWKMTQKGWLFVAGQLAIHQRAVTYRGKLERLEGSRVFVHQVACGEAVPRFDERDFFLRTAKWHAVETGQKELWE